ncbi:hypothetical protein KCU65_g9825, partial [Aureobasidium melanogenum]
MRACTDLPSLRSQKPSDSAISDRRADDATNSTDTTDASDTIKQTTTLSQPSELANLWESSEEQTEVDVTPVDHRGVMHNTHLVMMAIQQLQSEPSALVNMLRVCKFFQKIGRRGLWKHADPRSIIGHVTDARRRAKYASFIKYITFFGNQMMWPVGLHSSPPFSKVRSLRIDDTTLFVSDSAQLRLFLSPELRELCIWTAPSLAHQAPDTQLNAALGTDALTAILTLPQLEQLSLDMRLDIAFLADLLATKRSCEILPRAKRLALKFLDSEGLVPDILRGCMSTLEELAVTLDSARPADIVPLDPALLAKLGDFPQLRTFSLTLHTKTILSITDMLSITSSNDLAYAIGFPSNREFDPKAFKILPTAQDLINSSITLKLLEALEFFDVQAPFVVTYHEAIEIAQKIEDISPGHIGLFDLCLDEQDLFGWPSIADYEANTEDGTTERSIWQASRKSFAADPVAWAARDLQGFVDEDGNVLTRDQIVTGGSYNHLPAH